MPLKEIGAQVRHTLLIANGLQHGNILKTIFECGCVQKNLARLYPFDQCEPRKAQQVSHESRAGCFQEDFGRLPQPRFL
jgi:hypothetical protein